MGGHGGINILHQKKWHVYNSDNQAKVARDISLETERQRQAIEKDVACELNKVYAKLNKNLLYSNQLPPKEQSTIQTQPSVPKEDLVKPKEKVEGVFGDLIQKKSWIKERRRDINQEITKKIHKQKSIEMPKAKGLNLKKR